MKVNLKEAALFARIAAAAYDVKLLPKDCELLQTFEHKPTDTQAILVEFKGQRILAIRGTSNWQDCLTDLNVKLVQFGFGRAHQGFAEATKGLVRAMDGLDLTNITIVGHSLGGAIAALISAITRAPAYTFGQPMVGDSALAEGLGNVVCFVNEADGVPLLPCLPRYEHGGAHLHITAAHEVLINPSGWQEIQARALGLVNNLDATPDAIGDHYIAAYVENLEKAAQLTTEIEL